MNLYKAFYRGKNIEVEAKTSYEAQTKAAKIFKAKKQYEVTVAVLVIDGKPYMHTAID